MSRQVIQDRTPSKVIVKGCARLEVRYRLYRLGDSLLQDIHGLAGKPLPSLEPPEGMVLEWNSYEMLLRYALTHVVSS